MLGASEYLLASPRTAGFALFNRSSPAEPVACALLPGGGRSGACLGHWEYLRPREAGRYLFQYFASAGRPERAAESELFAVLGPADACGVCGGDGGSCRWVRRRAAQRRCARRVWRVLRIVHGDVTGATGSRARGAAPCATRAGRAAGATRACGRRYMGLVPSMYPFVCSGPARLAWAAPSNHEAVGLRRCLSARPATALRARLSVDDSA